MTMAKIFIYLILLISVQSLWAQDIAIVVHKQNNLEAMNKQQLLDIFMGRVRSYETGLFAIPVDLEQLRMDFYYKLTGRSLEQIDAYWARLMFSGQSRQPVKTSQPSDVIKIVSENRGAIGYLYLDSVDHAKVKVVFILN